MFRQPFRKQVKQFFHLVLLIMTDVSLALQPTGPKIKLATEYARRCTQQPTATPKSPRHDVGVCLAPDADAE